LPSRPQRTELALKFATRGFCHFQLLCCRANDHEEAFAMRRPTVLWLTASAAAAAAMATAATAEDTAGRYTMMPTDGGFVRLDTQTGVTSFCTRKEAAWACEAMPDAQQAMRDQMAKLEAENKDLKEENKKIEETFGLGDPKKPAPGDTEPPPMSPDAGPPAPKAGVPTEKDVDRMFDYIEGMVKKFKDRLERMQKEEKDKQTTPL
jgi:hypothetical protein